MQPQEGSDRSQSRPYRSKRHRPCDVCRRRKHGCFVNQGLPCQACRSAGIQCTFNDAPRKRNTILNRPLRSSPPSPRSLGSVDASAAAVHETGSDINVGDDDLAVDPDDTIHSFRQSAMIDSIHGNGNVTLDNTGHPQSDLSVPLAHHDFWLPASSLMDPSLGLFPPLSEEFEGMVAQQQQLHDTIDPILTGIGHVAGDSTWNRRTVPLGQHSHSREPPRARLPLQPVRSLGALGRGTTAQYSLLAGEVDPYLLRHMQFKDEGTCNFGQFQYRCLASPTSSDAIPVQFLVSNPPPSDSNPKEDIALSTLVPPELGVRLVSL